MDDLASLVGEVADTKPDAGREAAITDALRTLPQGVRPDDRFAERLRAALVGPAAGTDRSGDAAAAAPVRPE
ncbi:MAG TPA: hypothetical protein VGL93_27120 [Streptosporangiaceae bacterium]